MSVYAVLLIVPQSPLAQVITIQITAVFFTISKNTYWPGINTRQENNPAAQHRGAKSWYKNGLTAT